jgi:phenylacetic acid degradation operon negative regulatory protein
MTVIDELLVLLDDGVERVLDECALALPSRTKQTLSSTLGRLTGKGWVVTNKDRLRRTNSYGITKEGSAVVTTTLAHLKISDDEQWDGKWLFVLFNIPEKQRKYRDILRNRLSSVGFGRVQNSLWATARDVRFELEDLLGQDRIKQAVTILRPTLDTEDAKALVEAFEWDWESLNEHYQEFIDKATTYLKAKEYTVLGAKLLVYHYATLLEQDPKFPTSLEPREYLRSKAHAQYLKVRPYCYEE